MSSRKLIVDEFTSLPVSRERKRQLRRKKVGLCTVARCDNKPMRGETCEECRKLAYGRVKRRHCRPRRSGGPIQRRLRVNLSARIAVAVRRQSTQKAKKSVQLLGCDGVFLRKWIEQVFQPGMTWDNYGKGWHIDHIVPCAAFDLKKRSEQLKCFHYTNLQPLWAKDNLRKQASRLSQLTLPNLTLDNRTHLRNT